ncbi:hypothetical protein N2152v2_001488 [Parachlorella kessleri]
MFEGFRCVKAIGHKSSGSLAQAKRSSCSASTALPVKRPANDAFATAAAQDAQPGNPPLDAVPPNAAVGLAEMLGDLPLRLVIVGHNPSDHAWSSGHYYSNPTNWMWRILKETGIAPPAVRSVRVVNSWKQREGEGKGAEDDRLMPQLAGVGFTDVGTGTPGTDSSQFKAKHFEAWRGPFFARLARHAQRARAALGCTCGCCGAPPLVAFSGKRQFQELFQGPPPKRKAKGMGGRAAKQPAAATNGKPRGLGAEVGLQAAQMGQDRGQLEGCCNANVTESLVEDNVAVYAAEAAAMAAAPAAVGAATAGPAQATASLQPIAYQRHRPASIVTGVQSLLPEGWPLPPSTEGATAGTLAPTSGAPAAGAMAQAGHAKVQETESPPAL